MANPLITNTDVAKLFIGNNRYRTATYTNSTGSEVTIAKGTLLGRVMTSNKVLPLVPTATDGSEIPLGIAVKSYTVANGSSVTVTYCFAGDVAQEGVVLASGTLTTVVDEYMTSPATDYDRLGTIFDLITRCTFIILVSATEMQAIDNPQS